MMNQEEWMKLRAFKPLRDAGASYAEIARAAGCDWRTAKKYLEQDTSTPPVYGPRRSPGRIIDPYREVIDAWLRVDPLLKASVIHERLAAEPYGFAGHYQRVKVYVRERRSEILAELGLDEAHGGFHARFTTTPGAQAQVDWGDEGTISTPAGDVSVYSFHMVLTYSRDPFARYTTSMDLATFWACHREAFALVGSPMVLDNFSPHLSTKKDTRVGDWAADNNVELAYTPFYASWLNRIEAQFTALRYFTLDGTDHESHEVQGRMIRRYIAWRNRNAHDRAPQEIVKRPNVA
jgi:hypothetical protein